MKASQIFCMRIASENKKKRGYILAVSCVKDMIEGYICCDERENEFFAESAGVKFAGGEATFLLTGKENKKGYRLRLGQPLYSSGGKFLGYIDDYTVKGSRIVFAHSGKRKFPFSRLIVGDVVILRDEAAFAEIVAKDMFIGALCGE
ncbi:MAG: hypothetical protein NC033_02640 [Clostridiales bacterium]|nr:hypothetical protein [Clostridiales bacterium]